jgi:hypothetical protein
VLELIDAAEQVELTTSSTVPIGSACEEIQRTCERLAPKLASQVAADAMPLHWVKLGSSARVASGAALGASGYTLLSTGGALTLSFATWWCMRVHSTLV